MKVYEPSKAESKFKEALTQLYLMKHAAGQENVEATKKRIDSIRAILVEVQKMVF
tara:strand:- start:1578 stop:1742 length:165 start_codon:yes stop_codon:yes gene_type:complete